MADTAGTKGIRAGRAYVELLTDNSKLVTGLRAASARLKAFGVTVQAAGLRMMALGGMGLAPLIYSARTFATVGSELLDMSTRTGVSVEALSALGYAAKQTGTDTEHLETGLRRMQKALFAATEAAGGSKEAKEALGGLGLSIKALKGLAPERQFTLIADGLDKIADPTTKAAMAMKIFGKSGTALLPMIEGGARALEAFRTRAQRLGLILSTQDARAADRLGDLMDDLSQSIKFTAVAIGATLAPKLSELIEMTLGAVKAVTDFIKAHRQLAWTFFKVAAAIAAGGAALVGLGVILKMTGFAAGALATMVALPVRMFVTLAAVAKAAVLGLFSFHGILIALGIALIAFSGAGRKALVWLGDRFGDLRKVATDAWKGIADALAAGDIETAARIVWLGLQMAWEEGIGILKQSWISIREWFVAPAIQAFGEVIKASDAMVIALADTWDMLKVTGKSLFITFMGNAVRAFNKIIYAAEYINATLKGMPFVRLVTGSSVFGEEEKKRLKEIADLTDEIISKDVAAAQGGAASEMTQRIAERAKLHAAVGDVIDQSIGAYRDELAAQGQALSAETAKRIADLRTQLAAIRPAGASRAEESLKTSRLAMEDMTLKKRPGMEVGGTFSGAALWGISGSAGMVANIKEIAVNTEKTVYELVKLVEKIPLMRGPRWKP
jgi:hypothetical protein